MAQARMVRRLLWSAVVTVVVLMGVLAALLLVGNHGGRASLLIMAFPLIGFLLRPWPPCARRREIGDAVKRSVWRRPHA